MTQADKMSVDAFLKKAPLLWIEKIFFAMLGKLCIFAAINTNGSNTEYTNNHNTKYTNDSNTKYTNINIAK